MMAELLTVSPGGAVGRRRIQGSLLVKVQVIRFASEALCCISCGKWCVAIKTLGSSGRRCPLCVQEDLGVDRLKPIAAGDCESGRTAMSRWVSNGDRVIVTKTRYDGGQRAVNGETRAGNG